MSTFGGYIPEFPDIRVDYFRTIPGRAASLACFLSHVHSDHLDGLDNDRVKLPFIYCSAATGEILVRLEKRRDRLNLAQGILEKEKKTYKHLRSVLKPIPLETPTLIELAPKNEIRVTLFDANHCTGAVMFLFERENNAVLYTGDIRSEPWFVNNLTRNPYLIEYTSGMKTLDCIYLDTSNTGPVSFPTKAEGLKELIGKIRQYPPNTKFHFSAWTFGYEEVWAALSRTLDSQIHVDKYKIKLYQSLRQEGPDGQPRFLAPEAPVLAGCVVGNGARAGCLTENRDVRIHSCEKSMGCSACNEEDIVLVRPIITRLPSGVEIAEVGIGGGWGDLIPSHELAMDLDDLQKLLETVFAETHEPIVEDIRRMLLAELSSTPETISLKGMLGGDGLKSLKDLGESLLRKLAENPHEKSDERGEFISQTHGLPKLITFPYSRHSSYPELCHLVEIFKPKDVYPCTVEAESWDENISMRTLFGAHCSTTIFRHDSEMREYVATLVTERATSTQQTQTTILSRRSPTPTAQYEDFDLTATRLTDKSNLSTPNPSQKDIADSSPRSLSICSEDVCTPAPAQQPQMGAIYSSQTLDSAAINLGSSSTTQNSRRRVAPEMISPPPLKRKRLDGDSQMDGTASLKSFIPLPSVTDSEQQSLKLDGQPRNSDTDLILQLTTLMERLGSAPTLCDQATVVLLSLVTGDIDVETYIMRQLPILTSILTQINRFSPPLLVSGLHMTMRTLSQEALDTFSSFQGGLDTDSNVEIDVDLYSHKQLSPLNFLEREFKQATLYSNQSSPSQYKPRNSAGSLHSMSELFRSPVNDDADITNHQGSLMLVGNIIDLITDDDGDHHGDHSSDNDHSFRDASSSPPADEAGNNRGFDNYPFKDRVDDIWRCADCGHEIWENEMWEEPPDFNGFCTGCGHGKIPYFEYADFPGALPRIFEDDYHGSEVDSHYARELIGETHLDYESSAYDTQDEDPRAVENEDYETNSFVAADEDLDPDSESGISDNGSEMDYKAEFEKLQEQHTELRSDYFNLVDEFSQFKYDILGTSEEFDEDEDEDLEDNLIDAAGAHVVDVQVMRGDHMVTDVLVSSFMDVERAIDGGELELGNEATENEDGGEDEDKNLNGTTLIATSSRPLELRGRSESLEL